MTCLDKDSEGTFRVKLGASLMAAETSSSASIASSRKELCWVFFFSFFVIPIEVICFKLINYKTTKCHKRKTNLLSLCSSPLFNDLIWIKFGLNDLITRTYLYPIVVSWWDAGNTRLADELQLSFFA